MTVPAFPTLDEIRQTRTQLAGGVRRMPCFEVNAGELLREEGLAAQLLFKLELLQVTGTFKPRGALSVMLNLSAQQRARGVIAVSAGNHAIAVAYAARTLGISARVAKIKTANPARVKLAQSFGVQLELAEDVHSAFRRVAEIEAQEGRVLVHRFEGPRTVVGTASLGMFLEQSASSMQWS